MRLLILATLALGHPARAVTYEAGLGLARTTAQTSDGDVAPRLDGRFGLGLDLDVDSSWTFATGTEYVLRRVIWHRGDGARLNVDFDYVDVPARMLYRFAAPWSAFAGVRVGVNVSDKVETARGTPDVEAAARAFVWLVEAGVRIEGPGAFAFDAFVEADVGAKFAADLEGWRAIGARANHRF